MASPSMKPAEATLLRPQAYNATAASRTPSRSTETSPARTSTGLRATWAARHGARGTDAAVTATRAITMTVTSTAHNAKYHCCRTSTEPSGTASPTSHITRPEISGWSRCGAPGRYGICLLYTSDAADDLTRVDLGGRRIIKKK